MTTDDTTIEPVQTHALAIPRIGALWPGEGGIYAGLARGEEGQPDCHLILAAAEPAKPLKWKDALEWAKTVEADGHTDFTVPTRFESALLYANVRDKLAQHSWHWTSTEYSALNAFDQHFGYGSQITSAKKYEARVRAVRRFAA